MWLRTSLKESLEDFLSRVATAMNRVGNSHAVKRIARQGESRVRRRLGFNLCYPIEMPHMVLRHRAVETGNEREIFFTANTQNVGQFFAD